MSNGIECRDTDIKFLAFRIIQLIYLTLPQLGYLSLSFANVFNNKFQL